MNDYEYDDKFDSLFAPCVKWLREALVPSYLSEYGTLLLKICNGTMKDESWNLALEQAALLCLHQDVSKFPQAKGCDGSNVPPEIDTRLRMASAIRQLKHRSFDDYME